MGPKTRGGKGTRIPVRRNLSPSSVASPDVTMPSIASPGVAPPVVGSSSASRRRELLRQSSPGVAPPEQSSPPAPPRTHLGEASTSNPDFDTEALQPELYFPNTQFSKGCSIASKCEEYIKIRELNNMLHPEEKRWFVEHPQFSHLWHKPSEKNHKLQGVWLLLLRTAKIEEGNVFWFVVNGVPIRYSLREHGLISGLSCVGYPEDLRSMGSMEFFRKHWGYGKEKITVKDVVEKIAEMGLPRHFNEERLKMANLLFLCTVIGEKKKYGVVDEFFVRVAGDLELCRTFPWGRWTFDDVSKEIKRTVNVFQGEWKSSWTVPGFIIPLEMLACECIPALKEKLRVEVTASGDCPRMCKSKWRSTFMKGFTLEEIYQHLGDSKNIKSCLEPEMGEEDLMDRIFEPNADEEPLLEDPMTKSWKRILLEEKRKIYWEEMFLLDVAGRAHVEEEEEEVQASAAAAATSPAASSPTASPAVEALKKLFEEGMATMGDRLSLIEGKVTIMDGKLTEMQDKVTLMEDKLFFGSEESAFGGFGAFHTPATAAAAAPPATAPSPAAPASSPAATTPAPASSPPATASSPPATAPASSPPATASSPPATAPSPAAPPAGTRFSADELVKDDNGKYWYNGVKLGRLKQCSSKKSGRIQKRVLKRSRYLQSPYTEDKGIKKAKK